jgi:hypothetical protein
LILGSVRNRLAALFFVITAAAVGFIYLYVVPQLRTNLTADKLQRLERVAMAQSAQLDRAMRQGASQARVRGLVRAAAQRADARVTVLGVPRAGSAPRFVIADSEAERTATPPSLSAARAAVASGRSSSAIEGVTGERTGEIAIPLQSGDRVRRVAVLSTPLADVDDTVALVRRQILIAGSIALVAALAAGWLAARAPRAALGQARRRRTEGRRGRLQRSDPQ